MPTFDLEESLQDKGYIYIVGIDECARGNLAGPVFSAAVKVPKDQVEVLLKFAKDSKKLKHKKILELADYIKNTCRWSLGTASPKEIDALNILEATKQAMLRACAKHIGVDYLIVDGNMDLDKVVSVPYSSIIKADATILSVACASIVAKAAQIEYMLELDKKYPQYGFARHKGYGTKEHCESIIRFGVTPVHRKTFKRVREFC